jgi:hypothetical protein
MLFDQVNTLSMPFGLGPTGTVVTLFFLVILGVLNVVQYRQRQRVDVAKRETEAAINETNHWKGTAGAYEKELGVVRDRCDRLEKENQDIAKHIGDLQAKTDLKPLMEIQIGIVKALQDLSSANADRYVKAMDMVAQNTAAIDGLGRHLSREFRQHRLALKKVIDVFDKKMANGSG